MGQDPTPPLPPDRLRQLAQLDYTRLPSPCYVVHLGRLEENCRLLADVAKRAGCKILLAQKGFAMPAAYPLIAKYLPGTTSSGLHEALLAHEFFHGEVHVYSVAYKDAELDHLLGFAHTLIFNSPAQWRHFRAPVRAASRPIEAGLRVNPEYSEVETDLYNPCAPCSRLGTLRSELSPGDLDGLDGLHFHTLCEQDSDALEHTITAFEQKFGEFLPKLKWVNFGGGHHITRPGYDLERLVRIVKNFREKYRLDVYLEPGEAVALHTGVLTGTVLDLSRNQMPLAILDISATAHMPDVLEMPYRPAVLGAGMPGEHAHTYRLGGPTCLAGDVIGDYSFPRPLQIGDRVTFLDMAHYTMVKTTTFNGVPLPGIAVFDPAAGDFRVVRQFGYEDYRMRLG
ncbi:MAG TPA: carboxynorspermidine decarboxylase [Opitutales bacterium]|nr:carboxynorspermidine decarboxylase [Opitutales bacterium]